MRFAKWLILVSMLGCPCLADDNLVNETEGSVEKVAEAEVSKDEFSEAVKRRKLYFCPGLKSDLVVQDIRCKVRCKSCLAEAVNDGLKQLKTHRMELKSGGEIIIVVGKPGTDVRLAQVFDTEPHIQVTRFTLGPKTIDPVVPNPVKPDPVKPDPVEPDPKPVAFDSIHVVIVEDPNVTTPQQAEQMRQLRLLNINKVADFADRLVIYDSKGQDETGKQSVVVQSYINNIDQGEQLPYWFIVAVKDGKGTIVKEGSLTSSAEVVDEVRQARRRGVKSVSRAPPVRTYYRDREPDGSLGATYYFDHLGRKTYGNCKDKSSFVVGQPKTVW